MSEVFSPKVLWAFFFLALKHRLAGDVSKGNKKIFACEYVVFLDMPLKLPTQRSGSVHIIETLYARDFGRAFATFSSNIFIG